MPYRSFRKGKRYGKKRTYRKRFSKFGNRRVGKKGILTYFFKRSRIDEVDVSLTSGVQVAQVNAFSLGQLPSPTEFTNLYDSYKICGIKVKFLFERTEASVNVSNQIMPNLVTVNDFNDATSLTTEAQALEYASFKTRRLDKPITRYFRPTQIVTTGQIIKSRWNPSSSPDISHYGLKSLIVGSSSGVSLGRLKIYTTFYIAMRSPK